MNECMEFPETFKEFTESYGFKDSEEVYTNGSKLIPVFRVEQWLEHKQAEILDKISAEIEEKMSRYDHYEISATANGLRMAKEIVEKYKKEAEGKEADGR